MDIIRRHTWNYGTTLFVSGFIPFGDRCDKASIIPLWTYVSKSLGKTEIDRKQELTSEDSILGGAISGWFFQIVTLIIVPI